MSAAKRTAYLFGDVVPDSSMSDLIASLTSHPSSPLDLIICSDGGDANLAFSLAALVTARKGRTRTIAAGCVASSAALLWTVGDQRLVLPGALLLFHSIRTNINGDPPRSLASYLAAVKGMDEQWLSLLRHHLGIDAKTARELADPAGSDCYFSAADVVERGWAKWWKPDRRNSAKRKVIR